MQQPVGNYSCVKNKLKKCFTPCIYNELLVNKEMAKGVNTMSCRPISLTSTHAYN